MQAQATAELAQALVGMQGGWTIDGTGDALLLERASAEDAAEDAGSRTNVVLKLAETPLREALVSLGATNHSPVALPELMPVFYASVNRRVKRELEALGGALAWLRTLDFVTLTRRTVQRRSARAGGSLSRRWRQPLLWSVGLRTEGLALGEHTAPSSCACASITSAAATSTTAYVAVNEVQEVAADSGVGLQRPRRQAAQNRLKKRRRAESASPVAQPQTDQLEQPWWASAATESSSAGEDDADERLEAPSRKIGRRRAAAAPRAPRVASAQAVALDPSNRGHQLLERLGWSPGSGLGVGGSGDVEPVSTTLSTRLGLGRRGLVLEGASCDPGRARE